jgi:hypothetical protein
MSTQGVTDAMNLHSSRLTRQKVGSEKIHQQAELFANQARIGYGIVIVRKRSALSPINCDNISVVLLMKFL